jgi:PAS domain S-box-containing protein
MSPEEIAPPEDDEQRIVELVKILGDAEQELQQLTGGQLDSVAKPGGKPYLLADAQEKLRASEEAQRTIAETLTATLDALPAHIALIDPQGVILKVNRLWSQFSTPNTIHGAEYRVGLNYPQSLDGAAGECEKEAHAVSLGIRSVLFGSQKEFHLEYTAHSPRHKQWFRVSVTPVRKDRRAGAVVMHTDVTERRLAAEALRVTMEEFRTLAESMPQIVWMTRPDGWVIYFNQNWVGYTGLSIEESLGDGWAAALHPEDAGPTMETWRKALATRTNYVMEYRLRRADGQYRWWLARGVPQSDARGPILKWFGTSTDIHDLKMADLEISRTNRALTMLSACNEKLVRATQEQDLLEAICDIAVKIGGYRLAWVGFARDDEASTVEPIAHAGFEDGYLKTAMVSWSPDIPEGQGPAGRVVRTGRLDITEDMEQDPYFGPWLEKARKNRYRGVVCLPLRNSRRTFGILALYSETILKLGQDELNLLMELADDLAFGLEHLRAIKATEDQAALLDAASDAIILMDANYRIAFWNKGAERLYGWRASEVVGDDPRQIYVSDVELFDNAIASLMEKDEWMGELFMHSKNGREIIVDARWTLLRDEAGQPKSILAISTDITEPKKLEAQLMRVQRMESIGTLAGGIAHDLNNALAPILMGLGVLQDEITSDVGRQVLASMEMSAHHGSDLVRQVLSFARGVEGRRIPINPVHVLNGIQEMIRDVFPKNIDFSLSHPRDLWNVVGDPTQLHQVFTNLCVNARDAMPDGGALSITVENAVIDDVYAGMNPGSAAGAYVMVSVADKGPGIPAAIRDRIFEPFFTTKELGKGTGLGLSTTLGIVKNHGGFINLYSETGKGSTFRVYLPAITAAVATEDAAPEPAPLPRGNGELVLVVDDDESIRRVAQRALEHNGYAVLLAANGVEAVAFYAKRRAEIDLVLTDMAMPLMDGPTAIMALKALNPGVKIIGSSGMASQGGLAKAISAGLQYFVPKPYTAEALLTTIAAALRGEPVSLPHKNE